MHTVQKYITESDHGYIGYVAAINSDFFDLLPADLQEILIAAVDEASAYNRDIAVQLQDDAKQAILDAGTTEIITLTDAERQTWIDAVVPSVWEQYKDILGAEIVDELLAARN